MNYGLYIATSGLQTSIARQDSLANNLANVGTAAFKPDVLATRQRDAARIEDHLPFLPSNRLLERLGAGVVPAPVRIDLTQGPMEQTGRELDLAIEGEGFLSVRAGPGPDGIQLTRDGRLAITSDGNLVTAADGLPVLDEDDDSIRLIPGERVTIQSDGEILQNHQAVARLRLTSIADPTRLRKAGHGLFAGAPDEPLDRRPAAGRLVQGHIEASGTSPVKTMVDVTDATRAIETNAAMIRHLSDLMGRAINTFGRVT